MKIIRVSDDFGSLKFKGANSKLKNLETFSGELSLKVSGFGSIKGRHAVPRRREGAGVLQRDGYKV